MKYLVLLTLLLTGCTGVISENDVNRSGADLHFQDDLETGMRCYKFQFGSGISCVKISSQCEAKTNQKTEPSEFCKSCLDAFNTCMGGPSESKIVCKPNLDTCIKLGSCK